MAYTNFHKLTIGDGNTNYTRAQTAETSIKCEKDRNKLEWKDQRLTTYEYNPLGPSLAKILTKASKVF